MVIELFEKFEKNVQFNPTDFLILNELSNDQKETIENATLIFKDNIVGDIKSFGGNLKKNEEKFKELSNRAEEELKKEEYKDHQKEFKNYIKLLPKFIEKTCMAIIPIKEMPWADLMFYSLPRIVVEKEKLKLLDNIIVYFGEIKCVTSRTVIYGKMKDKDPLFAPVMGELEINFKFDNSQSGPKSKNISYINAILNSLDLSSTRNHLTKYFEAYQAHGDPICDFLKQNEELMDTMKKIVSGLETERISGNIAICGIILPFSTDNNSLIIVVDEGKDSSKYSRCFEGLLRVSATCCEAPSTRKGPAPQQAPQGSRPVPSSGAVRTPGGQELNTWTAAELVEQAQQRGAGAPPGMAVWNEAELLNMARERGKGIPEGMEVWDEKALDDLSKNRQGGGLNIPEWKPDSEMKECSKCGYALREGWKKCPVCDTVVE